MVVPTAVPSLIQDPPTDWGAVGLVLLLGGTFLLGNALLFRHPRDLVAERFGARGAPLVAIREHIFQRLQVGIGFLYLLAGFGLELLARLRPPATESAPALPVFWVAAVALATVVLLAAGWLWTSRAFRGYVRERLTASPGELETDPALTREVGELFGVETSPEDSVTSYAERVRRATGLPPVTRSGPRETTARRVDPGSEA
ncbi:MAG: hypothetical protein NTY35_10725 [Planctomycetota bacterium]|nr:hypothetical protein [Planctomycetota bacterium]